MKDSNDAIEGILQALKPLLSKEQLSLMKANLMLLKAIIINETKQNNVSVSDVSARLSSSLGECVKGNNYEIVAEKDGFWINHKEVGSGEPLTQWIDSALTR